MPYRTLDPERIIATAETLNRRVAERFPGSGLSKVAAELVAIARDTSEHARRLEQPIVWVRVLIAAIIAAGAAVFAFVGTFISFERMSNGDTFDAVQGIEASINTMVLAGLGFFAVIRLEERIKRRAAFKGLHGLRSVIHIIDMHQLTKDPSALSKNFVKTAHSPERTLTREQLIRYLDYCSEMLSLTGKLAALYAQALSDDVLVDAVNDIEGLGTNLSRKIWQKIMMIGQEPEKEAPRLTPKGSRNRPAA